MSNGEVEQKPARTGERGAVSFVALATGPIRQATRAVAVAVEQSAPGSQLVIAHESSETRRSIESLPGVISREVAFVPVGGLTPGALRNAAIIRCTGEWVAVIDGGERLSASHLDECRRALEGNRSMLFASAPGAWWPGPPLTSLRAVQLVDLLAGGWAISSAALFRLDAIERAGGYDEQLPVLADWELMLRLLTSRSEAAADSATAPAGLLLPLDVRRLPSDDVILLESLRADRHLPAVRAIVDRYRAAFESEPVEVLTRREAVARRLWGRERTLVAQRDRLQRELAAADTELASLRAELAGAGQRSPEWNDLRRVTPLSRNWGLDRGRPVDRFYIERFIAAHRTDIRGRVLELLDSGLTEKFGDDRVEQADVLDIDPGNYRATVVADLRAAVQIPDDTYDCIILTQTLHLIDDMPTAIRQAHRVLKPGGVLLVTVPCTSMVAEEYGPHGDFWRVLPAAAERLFGEAFAAADVKVAAHGNVLATTAFLYGLSCDEVDEDELEFDDPAYPLIVTVRAVKQRRPSSRREAAAAPPVILLYHRIATGDPDVHALCVPPDVFRRQVEFLAQHRRIVSLRELALASIRGELLDGAVALTFDDGYLDNLEVAAPILAEIGAPATFFLTSEQSDRARRFWWDVLETSVLQSSADRLGLRIAGGVWSRPLGSRRRATHDELYALVKRSGPAVRDDIIRQLTAGTAVGGAGDRPVMSGELQTLASLPGVEIGAHSVHHLDLAAIGPTELFQEIFECRTALERATGRCVDLFAYPYGSVSPQAVEMTVSAGYLCAVTCEARPLRSSERAHRLPRLQVPAFDAERFSSWLASHSAHPRGLP